jgi:methyl-accepting chemotaxis protein
MSLTISRRLGLLVAIAAFVTLAVIAIQLVNLRGALLAERQRAIAMQLESALSILKGFDDRVKKGELALEEAQARAKQVVGSIRFGENDYFFAYTPEGVTLMHAKQEFIGSNRWDAKGEGGVYQVRELIGAAKRGGDFVSYAVPRAGSTVPADKIGHARMFEPWNWVIGTGLYTDHLATTFWGHATQAGLLAIFMLILLAAIAYYLARGLINPVQALTRATERLANGDTAVGVPAVGRQDEVGAMARSVEVFRRR